MEGVKTKLDVNSLRSRKTSTPYPHIQITDLNKCVPVVISSLEEGDIPLLGTLNGTTKILKKISNSAFNIDKLLRVSEIEIAFKEDDSIGIHNILGYMEVASRWI